MIRYVVTISILLLSGCTTMGGDQQAGLTAEGLPVVMQAPKCRMGSTLVCKTSPRTVQDLAANCECAYSQSSFNIRQTFGPTRFRR